MGTWGKRTEQELPTSARLTAVQELSLGQTGATGVPLIERAPPPTPYHLFGSLVFFQNSASLRGLPWLPSAMGSLCSPLWCLGLAPLFPLTSSQLFCFCVITFSLKCELHQTAHTSLLSPGSAGCMQMPNNACRMAGAPGREGSRGSQEFLPATRLPPLPRFSLQVPWAP